MNELDPERVILSVCRPGEYYGEEAHLKLNMIAKRLHESIVNTCSLHSGIGLLERLYEMFDNACYIVIDGSHWFEVDEDSLKAIEKFPSICRYLLETALCAGDYSKDVKPNDDVVNTLVKAANLFLETCNYSNYLYYGDFAGGLKVFANGETEAIMSEKAERIMKDFLEKMRTRKAQVMLLAKSISKGEDYFKGLAAEYNRLFKEKYGISLSAVIETVLLIFKMHRKPSGTIRIARRYLIKKLGKSIEGSRQALGKTIQLFEISTDSLSNDWQYYRFYNVPLSVSRRPILNLSGKIGKEGTLLLGPNALLRAMGLLFNDIEKGLIELDLQPEFLSEKRGHDFEKKVRDELEQHNFKVMRVTDAPPTVGEIDAVALREDQGMLLVVEAKSPKIDLDAGKIKWQLEKSRKWCEQITPKVQWIKENVELIKKRLGMDKTVISDIEGIIVIEVPWYCEPDSRFKIITFDEFELFLLVKIA